MSKQILGYEKVMMNLNKQIKQIQGRSLNGLIQAASYVRYSMDTHAPLIPVDTGNLRQSWRIVPFEKGDKFGVLMGFSANYALFVHENDNAHFQRPGAGARFFEIALDREKEKIFQIIQNSIK